MPAESEGFLRFPELIAPAFSHCFTLRDEVLQRPDQWVSHIGLSPQKKIVEAEQTHGNEAAFVDYTTDSPVRAVDALVARDKEVILAIRVADCAPVYIIDEKSGLFALAHSGKKGTALNIFEKTVRLLIQHGTQDPEDLRVLVGPCIRPPYYEIDFASEIAEQAKACGITNYYDCGLTTAADLSRFYSYRAEKGQCGRHWALISCSSSSPI
ncbi:MAG: polyphenol oxidase family protein [Verrucomicrobiota bacterium]